MDLDVPALQRFAEPGDAARAAGTRTRLGASIDPKGLSTERYRELIERFRAAVADRIPQAGYAIVVLDRTAPDLPEDGRKAFPGGKASYASLLSFPGYDGAFAWPYDHRGGRGCVVTGFMPDYDISSRLSRPLRGAPVATGTLDAEAFHWFSLAHELGHCILGESEAVAETFAVLLALHEERLTPDQLVVLARHREADEWTNAEALDDHFVTAPVREVLRRSRALRADAAFMAMSVEEVAALARDVAGRYGEGPDEIAGAQAVRSALLAVASLPDAGDDATPGGAGAGFAAWVRAHADQPALRRLDRVLTALAAGGAPLPRFRLDVKGFRKAMAGLAGDGDAEAAVALEAMDKASAQPRPEIRPWRAIPLANMPAGLDIASLPEDGTASGAGGPETTRTVTGH